MKTAIKVQPNRRIQGRRNWLEAGVLGLLVAVTLAACGGGGTDSAGVGSGGTGSFSGGSGPMMAPAPPKPGYRMLGAIFEAPGFLFTLKLTGPEALVAAHAAKFDAFAQSLGVAGTPATGQ